jgi:ketosteroid isomerase-like protein
MIALPLATVIAATQAAAPAMTKAEVQAAIWAKEQAIYAARGRGDMQPYKASIARDYAAWPPFRDTPAGPQNLDAVQQAMIKDNKELLTMNFVSFVMNGDAAVIYYRTHRTRLPNGATVDERFEVTHSWVLQDGTWKVMGGMARATPPR